MDEHAQQPWQLAAMQKAADFGDDKAAADGRYQQIAALLSGMLHPEVAERLTAALAAGCWQYGSWALSNCASALIFAVILAKQPVLFVQLR